MDARKELTRARESYWIARRDLRRTRTHLNQSRAARSRPPWRDRKPQLPGRWFDAIVFALFVVLGIIHLVLR